MRTCTHTYRSTHVALPDDNQVSLLMDLSAYYDGGDQGHSEFTWAQ